MEVYMLFNPKNILKRRTIMLAAFLISLTMIVPMAKDAPQASSKGSANHSSGSSPKVSSSNEALAIATLATGDVKYKRNNISKTVNVRTVFYKNDTIITNNGRADIQVGPNAIIRLSPYSSINLKELYEEADRQNIAIFVNSGRVYSKIVKKMQKGSSYRIYTNTVAAGVRGTEFIFSQPGKDEKKHDDSDIPAGVFVNDGKVMVKSSGSDKETVLDPKEQVLVTTNGLKKDILQGFMKKKMEIFKNLSVMKKKNYEMLKKQKDKNKALLKKIRGN